MAPSGGRGRGHGHQRRAHLRLDADGFRATFPARWARMMDLIFGTRDRCAAEMGVTFQTACNWFDGTGRATGDKVALAALRWPDAFAAIMGDA